MLRNRLWARSDLDYFPSISFLATNFTRGIKGSRYMTSDKNLAFHILIPEHAVPNFFNETYVQCQGQNLDPIKAKFPPPLPFGNKFICLTRCNIRLFDH